MVRAPLLHGSAGRCLRPAALLASLSFSPGGSAYSSSPFVSITCLYQLNDFFL